MLMKRLENPVTRVTAMHMTMETLRLVVTASAEQIPSIWRVMGLLETRGFVRGARKDFMSRVLS